MLYKCANTACVNLFRSMSEGKLFQIQMAAQPVFRTRTMKTRRHRASPSFEHYWLCDNCSSVLTLTFASKSGLTTVPLPVLSNKNSKSKAVQGTLESNRKPPAKIAPLPESGICQTS